MPMPGIAIAEQFGLDRDDVATFKAWADAILGATYALGKLLTCQSFTEPRLEFQSVFDADARFLYQV